jgi:hypothetical protein
MTDGTAEDRAVSGYLNQLGVTLSLAYDAPAVVPGHDTSHVLRMIAMSPRITHLPGLDQGELAAAIWLHNLDRAPDLVVPLDRLEEVAHAYLEDSPFSAGARDRIARAAGEHHLKHGKPDDPGILTALRALDRLDRMNALGVLAAAATHGRDKPLYIARDPFRYELDEDGQPYSVYDDLAGRIMEFPLLLPPETRYLIDTRGMRDLVAYVRALAGHVCRAHGLENGVEQDLVKALGHDLCRKYAPGLTIIGMDGKVAHG